MKIKIVWKSGEALATLDDTPTSRALATALPIDSRASTWGEEVYFSVPVLVQKEENARQVVDPGTVCFWVEGSALALPYGRTPISEGDECRLAAACNVLGKLEGDPRALETIGDADPIRVTMVEPED